MRFYTKKLILSLLAFILGITVVACEKTPTTTQSPNNSVIPAISNPDAIFLQNDQYTITYGDLYNVVKMNDGLNQLLLTVDAALLADTISQITDEEVAAKTEELIYGTKDQAEIDKMSDKDKADYQKSFYDSMYLVGYGDRVDEYVRIVLAREKYAIEQMFSDANKDEAWYAGPSAVAKYYDTSFNFDIHTIKIRFLSLNDANNVMKKFNLVSLDGQIKLYTGDTPLEDVPISALNDTNTTTLTDAQILQMFIRMYNYIYGGYRTPLSEDATLSDLLANNDLLVTRDELTNANGNLDNLVYDTLGTYQDFVAGTDETPYYTYMPLQYKNSSSDTSYYLVLNLSSTKKADVTDFDGTKADLVNLIGADLYDQLEQDIVDNNLNQQSFASNRIITLRQAHNFNIYDYYLGYYYQSFDGDFTINEQGDSVNVASYDDTYITADQLLAIALNGNAPLYAIYAAQLPALIAAHYADVYCTGMDTCEYDVAANTSDMMKQHYDDLANLESQFNASSYASYYTFADYMFLAYQARSYDEMILNYYVQSTLQPLYIFDQIKANDYDILNYLMSLEQPYYDNYFDLKVNHLLIGVDRDEDGSPDDYQAFYDGLADQTAYDDLLTRFEAAIQTYLDGSEHDMSTLLKDYKAASREDATWGEFKRFGFILVHENLGDMTYKDSIGSTYEDNFVQALVDLNHTYQDEANINEPYLYSDGYVETSIGLHLIKVEKGADFERPSAQFTMTYDEENQPLYLTDLVNANDAVSFAQLRVFAQYRFTVLAYGNVNFEQVYGFVRPDLPASVQKALEAFYIDLYDALYVVGYMNDGIINELLDSTYVNASTSYCSISQDAFNQRLSDIYDIYMYQIFQKLDIRSDS